MRTQDVADLVLAGAIWGGSFMFQRIAAPHFGAFALAFLRVAIAAFLLMSLEYARGTAVEVFRHWRALLILGVINTAIPFLGFAYATTHVSAGVAAVLNGTTVLFAAVLGAAVFGERLDIRRTTGLVGGFAGVLVLAAPDLTTVRGVLPVLACLGAAFCYSVGAHFIRRRLGGINSAVVAAGSQVFAAWVLAIPAVIAWPSTNPPARAWWSAAAVGAICTALAYVIFFRLIQSVGATRAIVVAYLIPLFGIFWGAVLLGEAVTLNMAIGCAMIVTGIALASKQPNLRLAAAQ